MNNFYLFLLILSIPIFCVGQNDTTLYDVEIVTNTEQIQIMVDDSILYKTNKFKINAGTHYLKLWNPGFKVLESVIIVKSKSENNFQFGLKPADKKVKEVTAFQKFDNHRKINYTMSSIIVLSGAVIGALFHSKMNGYAKKYNSYFTSYSKANSKNSILSLKRGMNFEKKNHTQAKVLSIFGYSLLGIGIGYFTFTSIKFNKSKRPREYTPELKTPWEGDFKLGFSNNGMGINFIF